MLVASLLLGELVSRRLVASLDRLASVSTDLPGKIFGGNKLDWGSGAVVETQKLTDNLRETAAALEAKFDEVSQVNAALEGKVTERTRALQESEERYRQFFENNHTVMVLVDPESLSVVDANPAASTFYGWSREALRGKKISEINTLAPARLGVEIQRANARDPYQHEYQHRLADGSIREVEIFTGPIQVRGRALLFSIIHDISERRETERRLAEIFRFNEQVLATLPVGVATFAAGGQCLSVNHEGARIVGAPVEALLRENFRRLPNWETTGFLAAAENVLATGEGMRLKTHGTSSFGRAIWIDTDFARFMAGEPPAPHLLMVFVDMTERKQAEEQIQRALQEKEVLLKEVHHRVKNNMQVIYSLLNLQARGIADDAVRALFEESRDRVNSMALIHEQLYRSENLAQIDFKSYLQDLVRGIASTYKRPEIAVSVEMENLALDVNAGIPCGLMVNELVSNSFKHAFPGGRSGAIRVGISRNAGSRYELTVADDGVGFPPGRDFRTTSSLGLQLVIGLVGQIRGTVELMRGEGTRFVVAFPGPAAVEEGQHG